MNDERSEYIRRFGPDHQVASKLCLLFAKINFFFSKSQTFLTIGDCKLQSGTLSCVKCNTIPERDKLFMESCAMNLMKVRKRLSGIVPFF